MAENTLCSVLPLARLFIDLHIHRAYPQAFAAVDALILITVDAQQGEIAHGLEKYRDGTQIFAERPIVLEYKGKRNTCNVVKHITCKEQPKHNLLQICDLHQKQPGYQCQGQREHHIAENAEFLLV